MKQRVFVFFAAIALILSSSMVERVLAVDAPAPSPTAAAFSIPTPVMAIATLVAISFGFLLCWFGSSSLYYDLL